MASVERTAYPRFPRLLTPQKLQKLFTPSKDEVEWVAASSRGEDRRLSLMVQLKCFQYLHFFQPVVTLYQVSVPFGNRMDRHEEALEGVRSSCHEEEQVHRGADGLRAQAS